MDDPGHDTNGALAFACPHCGHEEVDDYEVIDLDRPFDWRCGACARGFTVLVCECAFCVTEHVTVGRSCAEARSAAAPSCGRPGARCLRHEEDEFDEAAL